MGIVQLRPNEMTVDLNLGSAPPSERPTSSTEKALLTRRQLLWTAGGALAAGAAVAAGVRPSGIVHAHGVHQPIPIPGGSPAIQDMAGGQLFHVFGPGPEGAGLDPIDAEPSTITDFRGTIGLAYLNGTVIRTNTATGEVRTLPMVGSDMRFMKGIFRSA